MFKEPLLRGIHPEGRGESTLLGISDSSVSEPDLMSILSVEGLTKR